MNEQENNITNTTTEPVVNTPVEAPVAPAEPVAAPVAETPITEETPTVTIGTPEVNIPEETPKKQSNGSKIFIVIIILVLALIAGFLVFRYVKGELDDNNLANEPEEELPVEVDTPETTPVPSENIDIEQTYTVSVNNNAQDFKFTFYYDTVNQEINGTTTELYEYMLDITTNNKSLDKYVIGVGSTKEEAKAKTVNNSRPTYNEELIKTIKDTITQKDYIVLLIPEYEFTEDEILGNTSAFITKPSIFDENGNHFDTIITSSNLQGYTYIVNDTKYGLTEDYVTTNYSAARIQENSIIYLEKINCENNTAKVNKFSIANDKIVNEILETVQINGVGQINNCE